MTAKDQEIVTDSVMWVHRTSSFHIRAGSAAHAIGWPIHLVSQEPRRYMKNGVSKKKVVIIRH